MQFEPPHAHTRTHATHVDTLGCVCSARTDVFTFIPRATHTCTLTPHAPQVHTWGVLGISTHTHCKQNPPFLATARSQSEKPLEIGEGNKLNISNQAGRTARGKGLRGCRQPGWASQEIPPP